MKFTIKNKLLQIAVAGIALLSFPNANFAQAPKLGSTANFVLFSTKGAVSNSGISQITGNVGTNNGAITSFGNVNGVMANADSATAQCSKDLLKLYNMLDSATATVTHAASLGNGDTLIAGVYYINSAATLKGKLTLNAKGNSGAVFIFQIQGSFASSASAKVILINGAQACNVFWKTEGAVTFAAGTTLRGTLVANNSAISMMAGDTLEGRLLSTTGAISVSNTMAYTPIGCGSPTLKGPASPNLSTTVCYALFTANGAASNTGTSHITGDVGTNVGKTTGFDSSLVIGTIHLKPDASTAQCASDLTNVYNYLDSLKYDIELLYPAQFGKSLVLTPHTYLLNAATVLTDSLYLNAEGNSNAIFVIQIKGALSTSTYSRIILTNGTQSKNVYWMIDGAVSINNYSIFRGTIICHNGALDALNTGVVLDGRALTTKGALNSVAADVTITSGCSSLHPGISGEPANQTVCSGNSASFSVTATGQNLKYQWRKGTVNLSNTGNISGATTATLVINPASTSNAASNYNVIISGSIGPNDTSANVALIVNTAPAITTSPANQTACYGNSTSFSVMATGTGITYQWRKGTTNITNMGSYSGANSSTLIINPVSFSDSVKTYNVLVTGTCAPKDSSKNVSLTINAPPVITTNPGSQTSCSGTSVSFSVAATGTNLTYQWRNGTVNIVNGGSISGATSNVLTIFPVYLSKAANDYNVIISGTCGPKDSSKNVSLVVNMAPEIVAGPANQAVKEGGQAKFTVLATGTAITYQWRRGAGNLSDGGNISGANTNVLTIDPVNFSDTASNYNLLISGTCLPVLNSDNAVLSISSTLGIVSKIAGNANEVISIYPNPFNTTMNIVLNDSRNINNCELRVYNITGIEVLNTFITSQTTVLETGNLLPGIYFYKVIAKDKIIQTGKLVAQH